MMTRGEPGNRTQSLNAPEAITCNQGLVYVADTRNNRIAVWDTAGNWVGAITGDFSSPQALAVTDSGQIFVVDRSERAILGLNRLGQRCLTISAGNLSLKGLCLSADQHHLFTLKPSSNQVLKYRIMSDDTAPGGGQQSGGRLNLPNRYVLYQPRPNPARGQLRVRYGLPRPGHTRVTVYDILGRVCRTLVNADQKPGWYDITWDRRDDKGRSVPAGVYFCTLETPGHTSVKKAVLVR